MTIALPGSYLVQIRSGVGICVICVQFLITIYCPHDRLARRESGQGFSSFRKPCRRSRETFLLSGKFVDTLGKVSRIQEKLADELGKVSCVQESLPTSRGRFSCVQEKLCRIEQGKDFLRSGKVCRRAEEGFLRSGKLADELWKVSSRSVKVCRRARETFLYRRNLAEELGRLSSTGETLAEELRRRLLFYGSKPLPRSWGDFLLYRRNSLVR